MGRYAVFHWRPAAVTRRPNPAYRPPEAGRTSLSDDRVSMPVATLYAKRTRPGLARRPCRCGLSERDFGLDHFQFGGHDLALGFRPQVDRDDIHDQRTDRAIHHRFGKTHSLVHCEVSQDRRDGRAPDRTLVIDEAGRSGPYLGREAFRQPGRVQSILAAKEADEQQEEPEE